MSRSSDDIPSSGLPTCGSRTLRYTRSHRGASDAEDPGEDSKVQSVIGVVVLLVNPLPPPAIAKLIDLNAEEVIMTLTSIQSLLVLHDDLDDPNHPVKPFHKSFPDFIMDPSHYLNKRFYISPGSLHLQLAINCLELMNSSLDKNFLSLPDYTLNSEVEDLPGRVKDNICPALEYACKSWYNHLNGIRVDTSDVLHVLQCFLKKKFLPWLEVVSVLGAPRVAIIALENLILWLQEVSFRLL